MSEEGASSMGDCYAPTYHLSDTHTYFTYPNFSNAVHYTGMGSDGSDSQVLPSHTENMLLPVTCYPTMA